MSICEAGACNAARAEAAITLGAGPQWLRSVVGWKELKNAPVHSRLGLFPSDIGIWAAHAPHPVRGLRKWLFS